MASENPSDAALPPQAVVFTAPRAVALEPLPPLASVAPGPGEVLVRTEVTAVSAGTEMLVYRGTMPPDIPADATLAGASGEQAAAPFRYPARYGYACVGVVHALGDGVGAARGEAVEVGERRRPESDDAPPEGDAPPLRVGARVFLFREHTAWALVAAADVMPVPAGVSALDAAFLPNVETAVSLAMDAAPLPGENVAVVGAGIVGLLLVAVLKRCYPRAFVVALDTSAPRAEVAAECAGADAAVCPGPGDAGTESAQGRLRRACREAAGVDVAVDVSGAGAGLDAAIRATRDGGRVVIGSWFGARDVTLGCLGGRFHRSHITLVASQVSTIPAPLAARWDKQRRFRLAWSLLAELKPAERFPVRVIPVTEARAAYEEIDGGRHLQVLFTY